MQRLPPPWRLTLCPLLLLTFGGCMEEQAPMPPPAPAKKAAVQKKTAPAAGEEAAKEESLEFVFSYSPVGKRDPFRSFFEDVKPEVAEEELTELQRFEIDQLKLVGIITGVSVPTAMIEDPSGTGHVVRPATLVGRNHGRVEQIFRDRIVIHEQYRDYTGRKVTNKIVLKLPEEAAEQ